MTAHTGAGGTQPLTPFASHPVPTVSQRLQFVSAGSDCRIDEHTRETLSAGWREIGEICHCEVSL